MTLIPRIAGDAFSFSLEFSRLANLAARPNFELQFNILQNQLLGQLDDKVQDILDTGGVNRVDAFLELEQRRLARELPVIGKIENGFTLNYVTVNGMLSRLTTLESLAVGTDEQTFDSELALLNQDLQGIRAVDGLPAGLIVNDGLVDIRDAGLGLNSFASYGTETERLQAVTDAQVALGNALQVLTVNLDVVRDKEQNAIEKQNSVNLQIQALNAASQAEILGEVEDLRAEYAQFLKVLSIGFETSQSFAENFGEALLAPSDVGKGTVLDIIT